MEMAVSNYNNRRHQSLKMTPLEFETYVKELAEEQKNKMEIFTYKNSIENPDQLRLIFRQYQRCNLLKMVNVF